MTINQEKNIIKAIKNGDMRAFEKLVELHKDMVFTLSLRMLKHREEAEEIAQDVFVKVFKSLEKFKGDSKLSTWIYKVTYNACLDRIKKNRKHYNTVAIDEYTFNKIETVDNALERMVKNERHDLVKSCVNQLPEDYSVLLTLFYFEELSLDEIAKILNIASNTVKVKLFRARKKLAMLLEQHLPSQNYLSYGT